jgi:NAD(P)-dependent dehydrogenase (short-subunit alcohol dehydrogenase family)
VQSFEPLTLPAPDGRPRRLREGGVYLITGGLGGVGLEVAECLARTVRARLALVGRSPLPARPDWDEWLATHGEEGGISRRLRRIQALEKLGSEVLPLTADVAELSQMQKALREAEARLGPLNGVIHAAGEERSDHPIGEAGRDRWEAQLRPRLRGAAVLERALEGRALDFCLLQSSLSSVLGAAGSVAYTASHVFLDAFAARHNRTSAVPWLSVNWDRWFTWREAAPASELDPSSYFMTADEAADAFLRVMSLGPVTQLVVSTGDLEHRIDRAIRLSFLRESESPSGAVSSLHPRPELIQAYEAPRNPVEHRLADIWRRVLGLEKIGINDDFFELGGDSVLSLRIVAEANEAGLRLTPRQLFEHNTIAALAAVAGVDQRAPIEPVQAQPASPVEAEPAAAFPAARLDQKNLDSFLARLGRTSGGQSK